MLQPGDLAPDFTARDQDGKEISPQEYRGKKLAIFFYPKDNTPTCTAQACNLAENYQQLKNAGYELLGISVDSEKSHRNFIKKYHLPFRLVADTDQKIVNSFGLWVEKKMFGLTFMGTARTTFLLDENGVIVKIIDKVKAKEHAAQILEL